MRKKEDQYSKTFKVQRSTETDPSGAANIAVPYMGLMDVWHLEKAAQDVGTLSFSKMCTEPHETGDKRA